MDCKWIFGKLILTKISSKRLVYDPVSHLRFKNRYGYIFCCNYHRLFYLAIKRQDHDSAEKRTRMKPGQSPGLVNPKLETVCFMFVTVSECLLE